MTYTVEMDVYGWSEVADILNVPIYLGSITPHTAKYFDETRRGVEPDVRTIEDTISAALRFEICGGSGGAVRKVSKLSDLTTYQITLPLLSEAQINALEETTNHKTHDKNAVHAVRVLSGDRVVRNCVKGVSALNA